MVNRYSEDELIARIFAPIAGPAGLGLRDDAALISPSSEATVATVDMLVAGVHFFADDPPGLIAKKALRVNLSDLAAKGAEPVGFLLSLALPGEWTNDWLEAFAAGLAEDARAYAIPLIGGDTTATPGPLTLSITALGRSPRFVPRSGARPGDALYVSGTIGDAALGLAARREASLAARLSVEARAHLLDRYLLPRPTLELVPLLRAYASAAMDVSDGLAGDLAKLCRASGVGAVVEVPLVPLSPAAREAVARAPELLTTALTGGDDYEALCAVSDGAGFESAARASGLSVTRIGVVRPDAGVGFLDERGCAQIFERASYSHF
jgi:thiamine-monophosphate kinase